MNFPRLLKIMDRLRSPGGCPWDRRQTMEDIKGYLIDESYEVLDAIDSGDRRLLAEELGDLLFQIVFLARLAQEEGAFDMDDVIDGIQEKMIRRHPHVFGTVRVSGADEVRSRWEEIKAQEGKPKPISKISGIPETLPALYRAYRLGSVAAAMGIDWESQQDLLRDLRGGLKALEAALGAGDVDAAGRRLGDLLFLLANLSRHLNREPEGLLRAANRLFTQRCLWVEQRIRALQPPPDGSRAKLLRRLWKSAARREKARRPAH